MISDADKAARELLAFYLEAGADALVGEDPVNRFAGDISAAPPRAEPLTVSSTDSAAVAPKPQAAAPAFAMAAPLPPETAALAARAAVKDIATLEDLRVALDRF